MHHGSRRPIIVHYTNAEQTARYFGGRPHVGVPTAPIGGAAAWRGADVRAAGDFRQHLDAADIAEIEASLAGLPDRPTLDLRREDFPLPRLAARFAGWRDELAAGRGFVLISGVPVTRWAEADAERFFWCFGQHLGRPGLQNPQGDLLGHIIDTGDAATDPLVRLYRTASNINYHCDGADVVGLLCLANSARGGLSRIASSVTVFDELLRSQPALARRLFEPVHHDLRNEQKPGARPYAMLQPACFDGARLRTFYHSDYFRSAVRHIGTLSELDVALFDAYEAIAERADIKLEMALEPGDVQLLSNHTIVHARTAYEDRADAKRQLLRLWLTL
jgi:Taurine catabolism dioxygenase TauD, TfdA family